MELLRIHEAFDKSRVSGVVFVDASKVIDLDQVLSV